MANFLTDDDRQLQVAIDVWRQDAADAVFDIEDWRDGDSAFWREWPDPPEDFYSQTVWLVSKLTIRYPNLRTHPLDDVCHAVQAWYCNRDGHRVPPQDELMGIMDRAMVTLQSIETDITSRGCEPQEAVFLGDGKYRVGNRFSYKLIALEGAEENVLQALVVLQVATLSKLEDHSGQANPSTVLNRIARKHWELGHHIIRPKRRNLGGYRTTIRDGRYDA
jgi:hypothetical protein